jgi:hypothetical protein
VSWAIVASPSVPRPAVTRAHREGTGTDDSDGTHDEGLLWVCFRHWARQLGDLEELWHDASTPASRVLPKLPSALPIPEQLRQ